MFYPIISWLIKEYYSIIGGLFARCYGMKLADEPTLSYNIEGLVDISVKKVMGI